MHMVIGMLCNTIFSDKSIHPLALKTEHVMSTCCCRSGTDVLLLLRSSKHNDKTWGLPGGNADKGERILDTAKREATEEMGSMPSCNVSGQILTRCMQSLPACTFGTVKQAMPLFPDCTQQNFAYLLSHFSRHLLQERQAAAEALHGGGVPNGCSCTHGLQAAAEFRAQGGKMVAPGRATFA